MWLESDKNMKGNIYLKRKIVELKKIKSVSKRDIKLCFPDVRILIVNMINKVHKNIEITITKNVMW